MNEPADEQDVHAGPVMAYLEGHIAVEAAIRAANREVTTVYFQRDAKQSRAVQRLARLCKDKGIAVRRVERDFVDEHAGGRTHGGVIAAVGARRFLSLEELGRDGAQPFIVMLDGIEDPFNFGQAVRALYAAGVDGLVLRPRNWLSAAAVVTRASAGATEWMPMAVAETALFAADFYRRQGMRIACTARKSSTPIYAADLTAATFLLIGGEKRGVTRSFLDQADQRLLIPYGREFRPSLGVATSTAVIAFEVLRQRGAASPGPA